MARQRWVATNESDVSMVPLIPNVDPEVIVLIVAFETAPFTLAGVDFSFSGTSVDLWREPFRVNLWYVYANDVQGRVEDIRAALKARTTTTPLTPSELQFGFAFQFLAAPNRSLISARFVHVGRGLKWRFPKPIHGYGVVGFDSVAISVPPQPNVNLFTARATMFGDF